MKAISKKEFTKECFRVIKSLDDEELNVVRKGFHILYNKLKIKGKTLELNNLNSNSGFLLDIMSMTATEMITRINKEDEIPY